MPAGPAFQVLEPGMRKCARTVAAPTSLVLALLFLWLWNRSYWVWDIVTRETGHTEVQLISYEGQVFLIHTTNPQRGTSESHWSWDRTPYSPGLSRFNPEPVGWQGLGFAAGHGMVGPKRTRPAILAATPFWALVVVTSILPAYSLLVFRRQWIRLQRTLGECSRCGYNLTGNVSGVCPECGTSVPPTG